MLPGSSSNRAAAKMEKKQIPPTAQQAQKENIH